MSEVIGQHGSGMPVLRESVVAELEKRYGVDPVRVLDAEYSYNDGRPMVRVEMRFALDWKFGNGEAAR